MKRIMLATGVLLIISCSHVNKEWRQAADQSDFIHRSIRKVNDIIVHDIFSPPVASRIYAYISIAAYEAAIAGDSSFISLAGQVHGLAAGPKPEPGKTYCYALAASEAALRTGRALIFSEDMLDGFHTTVLKEFKDTGMPADVFERSVAFGDAVGDHIIRWSGTDNYKETRSYPKYSITEDPSTWRPTPPAYFDAVEPSWDMIRTMVIDSAAQFKPEHRPTDFSENKNSLFYKENYDVYEIGNNLTPEQTEIAMFWDCNPFIMNVQGHVMFATKKISPGGHWMSIVHVASEKAGLDFKETAEAYARTSIALMDGFISAWDEKYRSVRVRPETYINQHIDENWTPLLQTPPFPEYTSAHSCISGAASVVLTDLFGENFSFVDSTETEFGLPVRSFKSFNEAASEAAISRYYGGIHYHVSCDVGLTQGRAVGRYIVNRINTRRDTMEAEKKEPKVAVK